MKILSILFFFLLPSVQFAQQVTIEFKSNENIKRFADYLFCDKDYLRAANEYERLTEDYINDTTQFKIALSYSLITDYHTALSRLSMINNSSVFFHNAQLEQLKVKFLLAEFESLRDYYNNSFTDSPNQFESAGEKLLNFSYLFTDDPLPLKQYFLSPFSENEISTASSYYDLKMKLQYKDPVFAGVLSAILPGSGKIYSGEYGDGVVAFLTSAVFSFIAYDNFKAGHNTRGWIWTGVAAMFYAGNVYGSIASAQIYNARVNFDFTDGVKLFLEEKNYFVPTYDFCK